MALDFVSPDNVEECIRLTEEFRLLPKTHRSKEDKLEVQIQLFIFIYKSIRVSSDSIYLNQLGFLDRDVILQVKKMGLYAASLVIDEASKLMLKNK